MVYTWRVRCEGSVIISSQSAAVHSLVHQFQVFPLISGTHFTEQDFLSARMRSVVKYGCKLSFFESHAFRSFEDIFLMSICFMAYSLPRNTGDRMLVEVARAKRIGLGIELGLAWNRIRIMCES